MRENKLHADNTVCNKMDKCACHSNMLAALCQLHKDQTSSKVTGTQCKTPWKLLADCATQYQFASEARRHTTQAFLKQIASARLRLLRDT